MPWSVICSKKALPQPGSAGCWRFIARVITPGGEEAKAVAMPLDAAGDQVEPARKQQHALAIGQQLAVSLHRDQSALQDRKMLVGHAQAFSQRDRIERPISGPQAFQDGLATGGRPLAAQGLLRFCFDNIAISITILGLT